MKSHVPRRARVAVAVGVAVVGLAVAMPAPAHPGHTSCSAFGEEHAFFARELGGLGQFFRHAVPLEDENVAEHDLFCVPK